MRMVFREGRTKAVGSVTKLYPHIPMADQQSRQARQALKKTQHESAHASGMSFIAEQRHYLLFIWLQIS